VDWITSPEAWIALVTLTVMEIVLGVDNIIFISILTGRLPPAEQRPARFWGLTAAMVSRIALLASLTWVMRLTAPLFNVFGRDISGRDLILLGGGLFLLAKATHEIHVRLEGEGDGHDRPTAVTFGGVLAQVLVLDIVFSLDSVITAIGMANEIVIMVLAVVIAVAFMMVFAGSVSDFVHRHPTVKMLALAFLLLIGMSLVADGLGQHIPKGYIYFAMAFSVFVEMLNLKGGRRARPVQLHQAIKE
jgi:predicted tellurium resistance membrane protein TerC